MLQRIEFLATHEPVIERMVLRTGAEATTKVPFLREERARIDAELRRRKEEARRLMDALAAGDVTAQLTPGIT